MSSSTNPFKYPEYNAWVAKLASEGARVATVAVLADCRKLTVGNVELGRDTFHEMAKIKRKESADWIPEGVNFKKLPNPLGEIYKKQNIVKIAASNVLKFFLDKDVKSDHGYNFMWEYKATVNALKYSGQGVLKS